MNNIENNNLVYATDENPVVEQIHAEHFTDLDNFLEMLNNSGGSYNVNFDGKMRMFFVTFGANSPVSSGMLRARFSFSESGKLIRTTQAMRTPSRINVG